jgi:hypothetical protein
VAVCSSARTSASSATSKPSPRALTHDLTVGLDTFGDRSSDDDGQPLTHAQTIRNLDDAQLAALDHARITGQSIVSQYSVNEGCRPPLPERSPADAPRGSIKYCTQRRSGIAGNDVPLDDDRKTGL